jgi:hypothetical protein
MKRFLFIIALLAVFLCVSEHSTACTIFMIEDGDKVLAGNNEDFFYSYPSTMWITAPDEGSYGRVCFANSTYVQGGMNEKGLFYDGAMCPTSTVPHSDDKPSLGMDLGEVILKKCSTVTEAVEMLEGYNIPAGFGDHILIADESGDSVVVEWLENKMVVISKENTYQIASNFFLSNTGLGGYPCVRFNRAKEMLESGEYSTVDGFAEILKAVSQKWSGGGTKYSNVCDLKSKDFHVYSQGDFSRVVSFNLLKELEKMKQGEKAMYDIDDLIQERYAAASEEQTPSPAENDVPQASGDVSDNSGNEADKSAAVAGGSAGSSESAMGVTAGNSEKADNSGVWLYVIPISLAGITILFILLRRMKRKN